MNHTQNRAYSRHKDGPLYAKYSFNSPDPRGGFGREALGETWINHYGKHEVENTRGLIAPDMRGHPIVRGVRHIWGPSDVYEITTLAGDSGKHTPGVKPADLAMD